LLLAIVSVVVVGGGGAVVGAVVGAVLLVMPSAFFACLCFIGSRVSRVIPKWLTTAVVPFFSSASHFFTFLLFIYAMELRLNRDATV